MISENHADISKFFINNNFKKIFLITGKNSYYESKAHNLFESYLKKKNCIKFFKENFIPEFDELKKIISAITNFKPDLILAIGGGSVIDYAKSANCLANSLKKSDVVSQNFVFKKKTLLCAIPTTAGSGAEVTNNAVLYVDKIKYSLEHDVLKPDFFFLIPELIVDLKLDIKASSGFDAIAQAIESILSLKSNEKSIEYSKKSLQYAFSNFENFILNPNIENTNNMCIASNLSGKAICISKTTAPHALSYPFTSMFKIRHGHAVSLTLNEFLIFNFKNLNKAKDPINLREKFNILLDSSKTKSIREFCDYMNHLKKISKLESNLNKLNINLKDNYDKIIDGVSLLRLKNNPVKLKKRDLINILDQLKNER